MGGDGVPVVATTQVASQRGSGISPALHVIVRRPGGESQAFNLHGFSLATMTGQLTGDLKWRHLLAIFPVDSSANFWIKDSCRRVD